MDRDEDVGMGEITSVRSWAYFLESIDGLMTGNIWGIYGGYIYIYMVDYPVVIFHVAVERSTIFWGGKSTISMAIFNSYVKLPEGNRVVYVVYEYEWDIISINWL